MKPRPSLPLLAALLTLAIHVSVAAVFDLPGAFRKYTRAAEQHLAGELPSERLMDLSPLYFELGAAATRLFEHPDAVLRALQIVLVAVAAGFLAALLARRFGTALAAVALVAFALDRHVLVYERVLEPEVCLLFFILGWLYFVERSLYEPGKRSLLLAGAFAAASLLTRPTLLPVFLLIPLFFKMCGGPWLRRSAVFAAPVAAALVLLMLRAAAVTGDPRTPAMNPGTVFYEGNNPLSRGTSAVYPPVVRALLDPADERPDMAHEHYRAVARAATGEALTIAEVNAYWGGLAVDFTRAAPWRYLGLLRDKLLRIFHGYRWHDVNLAWHYDQTLRLPAVPFALLAALALLGLLIEAERWATALLFYALAAAQVAVMLVFYVSARQRLVLLPALLYFALAALARLRRGGRRALLFGIIAVLLAVSLSLANDLMRDDHYVRSGYVVSRARFHELRVAASRSPLAAHVDLALDGLRHAPWVEWVPAYFPQEERSLDERLAERLAAEARPGVPAELDRAVVFVRAGRLAEAEALLAPLVAGDRRVYRGAQQPSDPRFYLARVMARWEEHGRAVALLEEALARAPGDPFVLAELFALTDDKRWEEALLAGSSVVDARYLLGRALLFHDRAPDAAAAFGFVVERLPEFRTGRIYLAAALGAAGRVDEGAAHYLEAVREAPDPLLLSPRISELFRRWAALHPADGQVQLYAAHVLHEHGHFRQALALLEGREAPEPLRSRMQDEIRRLRLALAAKS